MAEINSVTGRQGGARIEGQVCQKQMVIVLASPRLRDAYKSRRSWDGGEGGYAAKGNDGG